MLEIERKVLDISKAELLKKIRTLRPMPQKLFSGLVRVEYWDFPDSSVRRAKNLLRLREFIPETGKPYTEFVYKIYKGIKKGSKYFEEKEVTIPGLSMKILGEVFKKLGLKRTLIYEKKRTWFDCGTAKLEIDEHPRIPTFLEIEAPSPAHIDRMIKKLDLEDHEQTAESIGELMRRKYPKISLNGLIFK